MLFGVFGTKMFAQHNLLKAARMLSRQSVSLKTVTLFFLLSLTMAIAQPVVTVSGNSTNVGTYDIFELTMTNMTSYTDPWEDPVITAVFIGPLGDTNTIGGFYYATNTWKLRFAPREIGPWTWTLTYSDTSGSFAASGGFTCTNSSHIGFLRRNPANAYNFITDGNSNAFRVFGYQEGWAAAISATWPTDISQLNYPTDGNDQPTTVTQQLQLAKDSGFNMIRINTQLDAFDHLSPYGHFNVNNTGKNEYDLNQGKICDELMTAVRQLDFKCLMGFWNAPGNFVPNSIVTNATASATEACLRYHQYMINRFGAYVDIWELCNEVALPQSYINVVVPYIRANDPYQHLITMNGSVTPTNNLSQFDVWTFHAYYSAPTMGLVENGTGGHGMPVFDEECGNYAPFGSYDPRRFRIMAWTGVFQQTSMMFWGFGGGGLPFKTTFAPGGISNETIGWEEQLETKILTDFVSGLDQTATPATITSTPAGKIQSFALSSPTNLLLYLEPLSSLNVVITNATVTINVPTNNMQGQWIDPQSGALLKTITPNAGTQTLAVPGFTTDIALRLQAIGTQPLVQFSSSAYHVNAGQTNVTLTVYRLGSTASPISVNYATSDGLAVAGVDYVPAAGTLSWSAGDVSPRAISIPLLGTNNATVSADKQFVVSLSNPTSGVSLGMANAAEVMIVNTGVNAAVFSSPEYAVPMAATNAVFTLNRLGNGSGPLTVYFSTRGGTAASGTDYVPVNPENPPTALTPVTWTDGDLSPKTATVQILNSGSISNKTFAVALDDGLAPHAVGSGMPPYSRSSVVILATNTTPSPGVLAFAGYTNQVVAGFADTGAAYTVFATNGAATFQVARTFGSSGTVGISYATTVAGTAASSVDYSAVSGTLVWADGDSTNKTFSVPVNYHSAENASITLWLQLSAPTGGAILGMPYAALVTIVETGTNVAATPSLIVQQSNETIIEGQNATLSVVATGTPPITYQWQENGTNIAGATNDTYTIVDAQPANSGNYTVVISNTAGTTTTGAEISVSPFLINDLKVAGNDVLITWTAPVGSTNYVQSCSQANGSFSNISSNIVISGNTTTNYLDSGAATNFPMRFYRVEMAQ